MFILTQKAKGYWVFFYQQVPTFDKNKTGPFEPFFLFVTVSFQKKQKQKEKVHNKA